MFTTLKQKEMRPGPVQGAYHVSLCDILGMLVAAHSLAKSRAPTVALQLTLDQTRLWQAGQGISYSQCSSADALIHYDSQRTPQ